MRRTDSVEAPVLDDPTATGAEETPVVEFRLAFYRDDYVLAYDGSVGPPFRANSVRGRNGSVEWLRFGGRLYQHQGT